MKKLRTLTAVLALISMAALLSGCGDDDDEQNNNVPPRVLPPEESDLTSSTKTYSANVAGQAEPINLTFPSAGQYQIVQGAVTEIGTVSGLTRNDNTWAMNLRPHEGQGGDPGVLRLEFISPREGSWTFTPTGGQPETGAFVVFDNNTEPEPNPDPDPGPIRVGKTLQITYPGGTGEKFEFLSDTTVRYEESINGTYTWDPLNRRLNANLENGDIFEITIPVEGNLATIVYRNPAKNGGAPESTTGNYTLTSNL